MLKSTIDSKIKIRKLEDLIETPKFVRVNKFDELAAHKFAEDVNRCVSSEQPVVPIIIDSYGGQVYSLLAMVDVIKSCPVPVATIVEGKAMSCGAVLFSCGSEGYRFMGQNSTLMVHDVSSGSFGKVEEIKSDARETERLNDKIYKMMAVNVGKPENYFLDLVHERGHSDWYLTPEDAKSHNLTNHIRIPSFTLSLDVKTTFA